VSESTSPEDAGIAVDPLDVETDLDFDSDPFFDVDDAPILPRRRHHVTTVVVAHDGAVWLPAVLTTLAQQTRQTNEVIGVDNASDDASAAVLTESLGDHRVVLREANDGFGAAVAAGLAAVPAVEPPLPPDVVSWVWLLHDDSAADPTCLERLLDTADNHPSVVVLGPKVLGWHDRRLLLEVGVSVNADGRRVTGLERREHDQGQHDGNRDVLAVSTAGMLVRRDVWDELRGFDPTLPLFRDDLDFCWRVHRAGGRVMVATDAVVHHREASAHGRRDTSIRPHRADREAAVRVLLAHAPLAVAPFEALRLFIGSLVRAIVYGIGKDLRAAEEVGAVIAVAIHPRRLAAARASIARTSTEPASVTRSLRPTTIDQIREAAEAVGGLVTTSSTAAPTSLSALDSGPIDEDAAYLPDQSAGFVRRVLTKPSVLITLVLVVIAIIATRALWWGEGVLQGGALLPAPSGASDVWSTYLRAWHDVGPGSTAPSPPYLIVIATVATALFGNAHWAMSTLLLLAVPIAGWSAYYAARGMVRSKIIRAWMGAAYALLPAMTGAVEQGRVGTTITAIVLPFAIRSFVRLSRRSGTIRRAAGTALLMSVIVAATPGVWLVAVVLVVVASIIIWLRLAGRDRAGTWGIIARFAIAILAPLIALLPWSLHLLTNPTMFLLEPGLNIPGIVDPNLRPVDVFLLHPGGPGMNPLWITGGVVFAALLALFRRDTISIVGAWWLVALVALILGVTQTLTTVAAPGSLTDIRPWPGPMTLLAGLAMIAAGGVAVEGLRERFVGQNFTLGQPLAVIATLTALLAPALAAVWWIPATDDVLVRAPASDVPAFVAAEAIGPQAPRTLILSDNGEGQVRYTLLGGDALMLGDADTPPPASVWAPLDRHVADLASGRGGGEVDALRSYGVRYVKLASDSSRSIVPALDSEPGVRRLASAEGEVLWRIGGVTSRAQVLDVNPATAEFVPTSLDVAQPGVVGTDPYLDQVLPEALEVEVGSRVLWLGVVTDSGWSAQVDGRVLTPAALPEPLNWSAAYVVPAEIATGEVVADFDDGPRRLWLLLQGVVIVALIILALPERRVIDPDPDDPDAPDAADTPAFADEPAMVVAAASGASALSPEGAVDDGGEPSGEVRG
jgi:GT2 family glycosyltransferase